MIPMWATIDGAVERLTNRYMIYASRVKLRLATSLITGDLTETNQVILMNDLNLMRVEALDSLLVSVSQGVSDIDSLAVSESVLDELVYDDSSVLGSSLQASVERLNQNVSTQLLKDKRDAMKEYMSYRMAADTGNAQFELLRFTSGLDSSESTYKDSLGRNWKSGVYIKTEANAFFFERYNLLMLYSLLDSGEKEMSIYNEKGLLMTKPISEYHSIKPLFHPRSRILISHS